MNVNEKENNQTYGVLYVVGTPIGNLEDITLRALRILKEVDFILCEDKRVTVKLLNKYKIKTKLISFHRFNEQSLNGEVLSVLLSGKNIALVSDAGTPLISDPGLHLINELVKKNIKVSSIPGPSALTSALSMAPFDLKEFLFVGFMPDKKSKRLKLISSFREKSHKCILFVAPHDLKRYVDEIHGFYPNVEIFYTREMTKVFEETWCGKIEDLLKKIEKDRVKGEIVLILNIGNSDLSGSVNYKEVIDEMKEHIKSGHSLKETSRYFAKKHGVSNKCLYDLYIRMGNS